MEGVTSGRSSSQEHSERPGRSRGGHERTFSAGSVSGTENGDDSHPSERRGKTTETEEASHSKGATTWQSQAAKSSRHKWRRSPDDSLGNRHKENRHPEEKAKGRPSPTQGRRKDRPDSTRAGLRDRRGQRHSPRRLNDRRAPLRSPAERTGPRCCQDSPEHRLASRKRHRRRRHLSPEAHGPLEVLTSRLFNQVSALEVALDELRAPGGAFLRVPASGAPPEPSPAQRAWLSWQLAHTGADLHWALAALDSLLAEQPVPSCREPCVPGAPGR